MSAPSRLATAVLASALVRRIADEGGSAAVIARGDPDAGALLLLLAERGVAGALLERLLVDGRYRWQSVGPADDDERAAYLDRRRARDPDLWIVELDHARSREIVAAID